MTGLARSLCVIQISLWSISLPSMPLPPPPPSCPRFTPPPPQPSTPLVVPWAMWALWVCQCELLCHWCPCVHITRPRQHNTVVVQSEDGPPTSASLLVVYVCVCVCVFLWHRRWEKSSSVAELMGLGSSSLLVLLCANSCPMCVCVLNAGSKRAQVDWMDRALLQ